MGQYYVAIILGPAPEGCEPREFIRAWVDSYSYGCGSKLMEHGYIGNGFTNAVMRLSSPEGPFWKSRLVWAGDYADPEQGDMTLYEQSAELDEGKGMTPSGEALSAEYRFVVNHTKKEYVDLNKVKEDERGFRIHPLVLLTADGNGRGGGDYGGRNEHLVGTWARDVISVEKYAPEGYSELVCGFAE